MRKTVIARELAGAVTSGGSAIAEPSHLARHFQIARKRTGWKRDALAAYIAQEFRRKRIGESFDPSMVSKVEAGTKPVRPEYIDALPRDMRIELARLETEALGLVFQSAANAHEALTLSSRSVQDAAARIARGDA